MFNIFDRRNLWWQKFPLQTMDGECEVNNHLLLFVRKYVGKQLYLVCSQMMKYIRDNEKDVQLLGEIHIKKSQLTFNAYINRVKKAGTIVDELMICIMSRMYKFHIGPNLQEGKVWMTNQIDEVLSIKIWVSCAHGYFYNLTVPQPPAVVSGQGTELKISMPEIPKVQPKLKVKPKAKETKEIPKARQTKEIPKAKEIKKNIKSKGN